ncbi:MAG: carbamoyltransferase N-terminal domain-containing protein, partial [bacterium]
LVVSGGHTEIIVIKDHNHFKKIGQTIDDAAGEAFDKVAKLLKLSYPGGPIVSQRATLGNPSAFAFPRPMLDSKDFNFSFSGLKTAVLYKSQKVDLTQEQTINDLCASFEQAVVDTLVTKTIKAAKKYKAKTILMAGGVAANKKLRSTLELSSKNNDFKFLVPEFKLCTDNAAMIGIAAAFLADNKKIKLDNWKKIKADPNWEVK